MKTKWSKFCQNFIFIWTNRRYSGIIHLRISANNVNSQAKSPEKSSRRLSHEVHALSKRKCLQEGIRWFRIVEGQGIWKVQDTYVFLLPISEPSFVETCEETPLGFTATYFVVAFPSLIWCALLEYEATFVGLWFVFGAEVATPLEFIAKEKVVHQPTRFGVDAEVNTLLSITERLLFHQVVLTLP